MWNRKSVTVAEHKTRFHAGPGGAACFRLQPNSNELERRRVLGSLGVFPALGGTFAWMLLV